MSEKILVKHIPSKFDLEKAAFLRGVYPLKSIMSRIEKPSYVELQSYLESLEERKHETRAICGIWRDATAPERRLVDMQVFFEWLQTHGYWKAPAPLFPSPPLRNVIEGSLQNALINMMPPNEYRGIIYQRVLAQLRLLWEKPDGEKLLSEVGIRRTEHGSRAAWRVTDAPLLEAWCRSTGLLNLAKKRRGRPPTSRLTPS